MFRPCSKYRGLGDWGTRGLGKDKCFPHSPSSQVPQFLSYGLSAYDPDEQENNCHNKENVQPSSEQRRRNHPEQPQDDEQDHEKHDHRRSPARLNCESYAATTGLRRMPIPSISVSTTSPACSHSWGVRPMPTPSGVPVEMMSPGSRVQPRDRLS